MTTVSPRLDRGLGGRPDRAFWLVSHGSGAMVFALILAIGVFLAVQALPSLRQAGISFLTESEWFPDARPSRFGIAALAFGTVVSSLLALVLAVPVAVGSALYVSELAPPRLGRWIGYLVDLLAAVPSVVYGLWGVIFLVPRLVPVQRALDDAVGGAVPIVHSPSGTYGRSILSASVVLAVMVLPIVAALAREIFRQVPQAHREAAVALGATRWETIRTAVLPFSRGGLVGAVMLGLGRAVGETIAVALVLAASFEVKAHLAEPGGNTIAANIATKFGESGAVGRSALVASGLVLFGITLAVNVVARLVVRRAVPAELARP